MRTRQAIAIRVVGAFVVLSAIVAVPGPIPDPALLLAGAVAWLAFDSRHLLSLKNFFLIYVVVLFLVGVSVLHRALPSVYPDLALIVVAFVVAYGFVSHLHRRRPEPGRHRDPASTARQVAAARATIDRVHLAAVALILLRLLFLLLNIDRYGIRNYYGGAALLADFQTYGEASVAGGATQIVRFLLKFMSLGLVIFYAQVCFTASIPVRYRYPVILLVALPILSLHRYDAIIGATACLALFACERQVRRASDAPAGRREGSPPKNLPRRVTGGRSVLGPATVLAAAVVAAVTIGSLRQSAFQESMNSQAASTAGPLLLSEFSVLQAYSEIKENIGVLGHTSGRTIVGPLLLKVVPRAWFPDKPLNSGAYYMTVVRPAEFAAGFALPPTLFGDAYLSFGMAGLIGICLICGWLAARLDAFYRSAQTARLPWFILAFSCWYSLLRDPLSESLAGVLLAIVAWRSWELLLGPAPRRRSADLAKIRLPADRAVRAPAGP